MRTKNAKRITPAESAHMAKVKTSGCAVCDASPYVVEAHHTKQGNHWTTIGLCEACHRGPMGIHGDKTMWRIHKLDENDALNITIGRISDESRTTAPLSTTELPLRVESVANKREHWSKRARRAKLHRIAALAVPRHPLPCVVTMIRVAPRKLDGDNLQSGFKALRDGIATVLGVDDADPSVDWQYGQARGRAKEYAVRVTIRAGHGPG